MAIRPTRRGLLAGLAGGLFAWLAPKAKAEAPAAPPPAPAAPAGECYFHGTTHSCTFEGGGRLVYGASLGGAGRAPGPGGAPPA